MIQSLTLGDRRSVKYLGTTRIELDQVIDVVGPKRFFEYIKQTMENEFPDRDYNYAVDDPGVLEFRPKLAKEFIGRMDKMFLQIPGLRPAFKRISEDFRNVDGIENIDKQRQKMLDQLIKTEERDPKVKHFLSKLEEFMKDPDLPELVDIEKRNYR